MSILDALGELGSLGVTELSRELGIEKSGVSRFLTTLRSCDYVRVLNDGRYDLGLRLFELGQILQERMPIRRTVIPHVEALARESGETASAAHYDHGLVAYLHDSVSSHRVRLGGRVGIRCLPWEDVAGKAIMALRDEDAVLKALDADRRKARSKMPSASELLAEFAKIRERGYAVERNDEWSIVAAAVSNAYEPMAVALTVGGPSSRLKSKDMRTLGEAAVRHAHDASVALGWSSRV
jgi:DNA-binding IclR family transcriptional regulator